MGIDLQNEIISFSIITLVVVGLGIFYAYVLNKNEK